MSQVSESKASSCATATPSKWGQIRLCQGLCMAANTHMHSTRPAAVPHQVGHPMVWWINTSVPTASKPCRPNLAESVHSLDQHTQWTSTSMIHATKAKMTLPDLGSPHPEPSDQCPGPHRCQVASAPFAAGSGSECCGHAHGAHCAGTTQKHMQAATVRYSFS
jgi:hypothetical protein